MEWCWLIGRCSDRLFGIEFKPNNTLNEQTGTQAPAQAGIEDFNGIFPGKESFVMVAMAIDSEGHKHRLDFEVGSSESAEVVKGFFARLKARGG
jgi:hypothetical protein